MIQINKINKTEFEDKIMGDIEIRDSHLRSAVKSGTYRILILTINGTIAYVITSSFAMAAMITLATEMWPAVWYYIHERIWNKIPWGKSWQNVEKK